MRKKNLVIAGCAVIVIALGAAVIFGASRNQEQVLVADVPPVVEGENPQLRTIEVNSELMGTVEPDSLVYVTPLGAGEITSVNIKAGDQVQAGQVLCVIDTKQVESSRIAVETARIWTGIRCCTRLERYQTRSIRIFRTVWNWPDFSMKALKMFITFSWKAVR